MSKRVGVIAATVAVGCLIGGGAASAQQRGSAPYCQIMDGTVKPVYEGRFAFLASRAVEAFDETLGETAYVELDGYWDYAYFRDILYGDIEIGTDIDIRSASSSGGIILPEQVMEFYMDLAWTWRYVNGTSLRTEARPGFYGAFDAVGEAFHVPVELDVIHSFGDTFSGVLGVEWRPGFLNEFIPQVGLVWQPVDPFRLEAGFPSSRLDLQLTSWWSAYLGYDWQSRTYNIGTEGAVSRDRVTFGDSRLLAGLAFRPTDELQVTVEFGTVFDRTIEFEAQLDELPVEVDLANAPMLRIAIGGPF